MVKSNRSSAEFNKKFAFVLNNHDSKKKITSRKPKAAGD